MRICLLCNEYPPGPQGGVGSVTRTLGRALVTRGHHVTVVGTYPPERAGVEDDRGVRVVRLAHTRVRGAGFVANGARLGRTLWSLHRESPFDVLEGPESSLAMVPKGLPAEKIIRMHGGHHFFAVTLGAAPRPWRSWLERRSFGRADALCAVSRYVGETTRGLLGLGGRPIEVLPNPVDVSLFRPRPEIPEEPGVVLFAGTVCEKKGVRQLVQALPAVIEAVPHARLVVAGRDWTDPGTGESFTEGLRRLVPPGLADRVDFLGRVEHDDLPALIARSQVCAFPSHMEAQGLVVVEGMAMGKAVVASRTGPGPELIDDATSGLLCDPYDPASIAERVVRLLKDPGLRRRVAAGARERAVGCFSVDVLAGRNEAFYERCLGSRNGL